MALDLSGVFNGSRKLNFSEISFQQGKRPLDKEFNLVQRVSHERFLDTLNHVLQFDSGWLKMSSFSDHGTNVMQMGTTAGDINRALVGGRVIEVRGTSSVNDYDNVINFTNAPTGSSRYDLVYLEVWEAVIQPNYTIDKPDATHLYTWGNKSYGGTNLNDELQDPTIGEETAGRVQIQYKIRVAEGYQTLTGVTCLDGTNTFATATDILTGDALPGVWVANNSLYGAVSGDRFGREEFDANNDSLSKGFQYAILIAYVLRPDGDNTIISGNVTDLRDLVDMTTVNDIVVTGDLLPTTDNLYNIGSASKQWKDLYLTGASIYMGGTVKVKIDSGALSIRNNADSAYVGIKASDVTASGGINLGTATGATTGQLKLSSSLNFTTTAAIIALDTADGADTGSLNLSGGGSVSASRGGRINIHGNESSLKGQIVLNPGLGDSSTNHGYVRILQTSGIDVAQFGIPTSNSDISTSLFGGLNLGTATGATTGQLIASAGAIFGGHVTPDSDSDHDLGTSSLKWRDLYLSGASIYMAGSVKLKVDTGALRVRNNGDTADADIIVGNLTVNGTQTIINSNIVNIGDSIITLNSDETGSPTQDGGFEIERGTATNATLIWSESNAYFMAGIVGSEKQLLFNTMTQTPILAGGLNIGTATGAATGQIKLKSANTNTIWAEAATGTDGASTAYVNAVGAVYCGVDSSIGARTGSNYAAYLLHAADAPLILGTNGTPRLTISNTGAATFTNSIQTTSAGTSLGINTTANSTSYMNVSINSGTINSIFGSDPSAGGSGFAGTITNHSFAIRTNNTARLTISNTGDVSIPSGNLTVGDILMKPQGSAFRMRNNADTAYLDAMYLSTTNQLVIGNGMTETYLTSTSTTISALNVGSGTGAGTGEIRNGQIAITQGAELVDWSSNSDTGAIHINYRGYNLGNTKYRDLFIGDGKNNWMAWFDGSSNSTFLYGGLNIGSATGATSGQIRLNTSGAGTLTFQGNDGNQPIANEPYIRMGLASAGDLIINPGKTTAGIYFCNDIAGTVYMKTGLNVGAATTAGIGEIVSNASHYIVVTGESIARMELSSNSLNFGDGTNARDTNLYRVSANALKTDDNFYVGDTGNAKSLYNYGAYTIDVVGLTPKDLYVGNTGLIGYTSSSLRYKENVADMGTKSELIYDLRPVTFDYIDKEKGSNKFGLIAEEVFEVLPCIVPLDEEGRPDTVTYSFLIPMLLNEVQKLKKEIEALKAKQ